MNLRKKQKARNAARTPKAISAAEAAALIDLHVGATTDDQQFWNDVDWRFQMLLIHDKTETPSAGKTRAALWGEVCSGRATAAQRRQHDEMLAELYEKAEKQIREERAAKK